MSLTVCVTSIGSLSAAFIVERLRLLGARVIGLNSTEPQAQLAATDCDKVYRVPHSDTYRQFLFAALRICLEEKATVIIPLTDPEACLLSKHHQRFGERGITVFSPSYTSISRVIDKYNLFLEVSSSPSPSPNVKAIPTALSPDDITSRFGYPIVSKPRVGRSSRGLSIQHCDRRSVDQSPDVIFQPYIAGSVVTVDVYRSKTSTRALICPRYEHNRTANGAGVFVESFYDSRLEEFISGLMFRLNMRGLVNLEFIRSGSMYYLMDFNVRASGGIEFSYYAGADFLGAAFGRLLGKRKINFKKKTYLMRREVPGRVNMCQEKPDER